MVAIDLTGGLAPATDEVTAEAPSDPAYREGTSMWIWDDGGRVGLPRCGVECVGATWDTSRMTILNLTLPDGRVLLDMQSAQPVGAADADGRPRVLGAGPMRFVCVEPYLHWQFEFDGTARAADVAALTAARIAGGGADVGEMVDVNVSVDARTVCPPWVQGSLEPDGAFIPGEQRFEQLFRANGTVTIGGDSIELSGGGLRIHRVGGNRSDYTVFRGHCWQSTFFPSGRAFGMMQYMPNPDGSPRYHEGWILDDGRIMPAKYVDAPWLRDTNSSGQDVSFTARTADGDIHIEATTSHSVISPERKGGDVVAFPTLQQGIATYRWGDEAAQGMIERSARI
jgi:hypothetical protein